MKRVITASLLVFLSLAALVLFLRLLLPFFASKDAYLSVSSSLSGTQILLDKDSLGETPLQAGGLKTGDHKLTLKAKIATESSKYFGNREVVWSNQVRLVSNTLAVVNIDFGPNDAFNSVEVLSLRKGSVSLSVTSEPSGAKIEVDGEEIGSSPLVREVKPGVHRVVVSKDGYLSRQIDINVPQGHQTILQITLSADPLAKTTEKIDDQDTISLYTLTTPVENLVEKPEKWVEGVWFFQEQADKLKTKFDVLIDRQGQVYFYDKTNFEKQLTAKGTANVGYLTSTSDTSLTSEAKSAWENLVPKPKVAQIEILDTPTGNLNVREGPSQSNKILTTVKPGDKYDLLKEQSGWYQIKVGTINGWVSSQYAKKI